MGMEFVSMYVRYDANITRTTGESFNKFSSFFQVSFLPLESSKHQNVFIIDVRKCVIYISINYKKKYFFFLLYPVLPRYHLLYMYLQRLIISCQL